MKSNFRLLVIFSVAFSLATLSGPLSSRFQLPTIQPANAVLQLCQTHGIGGACSEYWYPAGPEENTLVDRIFTDESAEFVDLQSSLPSIDFTDTPLPSASIKPFFTEPNFVVTGPISQAGYFEIQFMLANNFWGCNFNFGNSTCGVDVRQGIWHTIDTASFATNEPSLTGQAVALDSPNPSDNQGGLPSANPCNWDPMFPETGSNCVVGAPGGTAYHLANASGAGGFAWNQAPGSRDMDAAAAHFVAAGLAAGCDGGTGVASCLASTDSILSGITSAASNHPVNFFIRNDDLPRLDFGNSLAEQICWLFTGSYTVPCAPYLSVTRGPITAFPGFTTSTTSVNLSWGMYTAAYGSSFGALPFDSSFYFTYNSQFVSGIPSIKSPTGLCSAGSLPEESAPDYMYLCDPVYDNVSSQIESAPCLNSVGDPTLGSSSNGPGGDCPGTAQLSAVSAGLLAEDRFGKSAYTIGVFEQTEQFGYLNAGWTRVVNDDGAGLPNFFTWLNAWNPSPPVSGTIRQGFRQTTSSVSPFIEETVWDSYMVNNVYDSLYRPNPLNPGQLVQWMTVDSQQLANSQLTYAPPLGTIQTLRLTLRPDLFFQDGSPVTAYDVAFSYLNTVNTFRGAGTIGVAGVTVLGIHQFDINLDTLGPFTLSSLLTVPIMPGEFWNNLGSSAWNHAVSICGSTGSCFPAQYIQMISPFVISCTLSCASFPGSLMNVNIAETGTPFDPITHHIFIGSGPWQCGTGSGLGGPSCSSSGTQNPPIGGSYTLTRFGNGIAPGSSVTGAYFRSSGNLALWIWSQDNGDTTHDFLNFAVVAGCFGAPVTSTGPCAHFQQGIGASSGPVPVGLSQISIVNRFFGVNWVAPYNWQTSPPTGIAPFPPTLYEGTTVLNPAGVIGCPTGYDC